MANNNFHILRVKWNEHGTLCAMVREKVFVYEMRFRHEADQDGRDNYCQHVLAVSEEGDPIGTGRIDPDGKISRIAVLMPWRQSGVGSALLNELICVARDRTQAEITLSAPLFAVEFYRANHFETTGSVFMDEGVPHQRMSLQLPTPSYLIQPFGLDLAHAN